MFTYLLACLFVCSLLLYCFDYQERFIKISSYELEVSYLEDTVNKVSGKLSPL